MNSAMTITESTVTAAAPSAKLSKAGPVLDLIARKPPTNFAGTASLTKMKSATMDFPSKVEMDAPFRAKLNKDGNAKPRMQERSADVRGFDSPYDHAYPKHSFKYRFTLVKYFIWFLSKSNL